MVTVKRQNTESGPHEEQARGGTPCELVVDASGVRDKAAFLAAVARDLHLPSYFGGNWDALEECLADRDWAPEALTTIAIRHAGEFAAAAPSDLQVFKDIVADLARHGDRAKMSVRCRVDLD